MNLRLIVLTTLMPLAACAQEQKSKPDFDSLRKSFIQKLEGRDLEGSINLYDAQATFINPDGTHVMGLDIRKLFAMVFAAFHAKITMTPRTTEASGTLAYESGSYEETLVVEASKERKHVAGDYLTIYRQTRSNKWLIVQQVWTEGPSK